MSEPSLDVPSVCVRVCVCVVQVRVGGVCV